MSEVALNVSDTACICGDIHEDEYSIFYSWFNYLLIICVLPWLSIFGLLTNICNIFIFSRKRMITSANTYLFFLACSDFLVILTGVFIFWIDSARSYIQALSLAPYTTVYALPFGYMAQTGSICKFLFALSRETPFFDFTVGAAVDCYITVCWKSQAKSYCTVRRARQIVVSIAICSILYNSMRFPQFNLRQCVPEGSQDFMIEICPTPLYFAMNTFYNVYLYLIFMTFLPFIFLLFLNVFIVAKQSAMKPLTTSRKTSLNLAESANGMVNHKAAAENKNKALGQSVHKDSGVSSSGDDTITMISVVILFLACNVLALVINLIETFGNYDQILINLLSDASNFLVVFNSSVNCLIYYIFNKEYRDSFLHYYFKIKRNCCLGHKIARSRPNDLFHNGSVDCNGMTFLYTKARTDPFGVSSKTNDNNQINESSPVWQHQTCIPYSNAITPTKLSPPNFETLICNGSHNSTNLTETGLLCPISPFIPSIYPELLLMDDEVS